MRVWIEMRIREQCAVYVVINTELVVLNETVFMSHEPTYSYHAHTQRHTQMHTYIKTTRTH